MTRVLITQARGEKLRRVFGAQASRTTEDLRAVNTFYASPVGQKLLSTLPAVMQEGMQVGQQWGREMGEAAAKEAAAQAKAPGPAH